MSENHGNGLECCVSEKHVHRRLIVKIYECTKNMSNDFSERGEAVSDGAIQVSVFGCLVWPRIQYEFVEAKDHQAWLREREQQVDFMLEGVAVRMVGRKFVGNVMACRKDLWSEYLIKTG